VVLKSGGGKLRAIWGTTAASSSAGPTTKYSTDSCTPQKEQTQWSLHHSSNVKELPLLLSTTCAWVWVCGWLYNLRHSHSGDSQRTGLWFLSSQKACLLAPPCAPYIVASVVHTRPALSQLQLKSGFKPGLQPSCFFWFPFLHCGGEEVYDSRHQSGSYSNQYERFSLQFFMHKSLALVLAQGLFLTPALQLVLSRLKPCNGCSIEKRKFFCDIFQLQEYMHNTSPDNNEWKAQM